MYIEKEVTVEELKSFYESNEYDIEIDSPDGYQLITKWYNKGMLPMVKLTTLNHSTICAENHLLQLSSNHWCLASELEIGNEVITQTGNEIIIDKIILPLDECYDFTVNHQNHRYWGDGFSSHNSGKSYICSGNVVRNAQEQGIYVVLVDSENALDEAWLHALGVDTSESKLLKLNLAMIDDVAKTISEFVKHYKALSVEDRPKVLFVIDSLGMLMTPTDVSQFEAGDMKGDMGRKPKALTALVRNCVNMFGGLNIGLLATNHSYQSQDMFDPDDKISGGQGFIYASSIVVAMQKLKLKEDEAGNKVTDVRGIRSKCKIMKTRYNKPFEDIELRIPWETGMDPYTGLVDLFEKKNILTKDGNKLSYTDLAGNTTKYFRKEWIANNDKILDKIMTEFTSIMNQQTKIPLTTSDE